MKLGVSIISYALAREHTVRRVSNSRCTKSFAGPVFLLNDPNGHKESLVVISAADLEVLSLRGESYPDTLFICAGELHLSQRQTDLSIIEVSDNVSVFSLFNELQDLYQRFEAWENSLRESCFETESFQGLLEKADLVLHHPIALQDKDFHLVAFSDLAVSEHILEYINEMNNITIDVVSRILADGTYARIIKNEQAYTFNLGVLQGVAINIRNKDKFIGTILVNCPNNEEMLVNYYTEVLQILMKYTLRLFEKRGYFESLGLPSSSLKKTFVSAISGEEVQPDEWKKALLDSGWGPNDQLQLIAMRIFDGNTMIYEGYLRNEVERTWTNSVVADLGDFMVILVNLATYECPNNRDFPADLFDFAEKTQLVPGVSRTFVDFKILPSAFLEAKAALYFSGNSQAGGHYIWFDEIAPVLLLKQGVGAFRPERICSEKVSALLQHDKDSGTAYFETLCTYFDNRFNAVASAKALYIQRSSLFYRLAKIRALAGLDLNLVSSDEILYLAMSLKILS